jgi:hypothetical protein
MGALRRRRLNWRLLRLALALSAGCLLVPSQARASCGDYVHVGTEPGRTETPAPPAREHPPCHGPSCSGAPSPDPLTTAPPAPPRDRELAALAFPTLLPTSCPLDALADNLGRLAVRRGNSIFHPPR